MGYGVKAGAGFAETRPGLKDGAVVELELYGRGAFSYRQTAQPGFPEATLLWCNTISSPTFGGTVRAARFQVPRQQDFATCRWEVDCESWEGLLNAERPLKTYTSMPANSIVADLVDVFGTSFGTTGISDVKCAGSSLAWDTLTVSFDQTLPLTDCVNSVVGMVTPIAGQEAWPPHWWVDESRGVHLVGAMSSLGVVIDIASSLDTISYEVGLEVSSLVTSVFVWCGSIDNFFPTSPANTSIRVSNAAIVGLPTSLIAGDALYLAANNELIPVTSVVLGTHDIYVSSLNWKGVPKQYIPSGGALRAVVEVNDVTRQIAVGSVYGGDGIFEMRTDLSLATTGAPTAARPVGNSLLTRYGGEVSYVRVRTFNSLCRPGAILRVNSLWRGDGVPWFGAGDFPIQRVRISGFDRGEGARPVYDVEASVAKPTRVTDVL
jgi:hypothetical protein